VHEPLQLPWHLAVQLALPGVPEQLVSHSAAKVARHEALHRAWFASDAHCASHLAVASALQLAVQSNSAGFALQSASQLPWQLPVQLTDGSCGQSASQLTSSLAAHAACTLSGVHSMSQPSTLTSHMPCASTSMLPQAPMPARAGVAVSRDSPITPLSNNPEAKRFFIQASCSVAALVAARLRGAIRVPRPPASNTGPATAFFPMVSRTARQFSPGVARRQQVRTGRTNRPPSPFA